MGGIGDRGMGVSGCGIRDGELSGAENFGEELGADVSGRVSGIDDERGVLGDEFVIKGGVVGGDEDAVLLCEEFGGEWSALHWWEVVVPHFGE